MDGAHQCPDAVRQSILSKYCWSVEDDTIADKLVRKEAACWAVSHVKLAVSLYHCEAVQNEDPDCRMTKYLNMQRKTQPVCQPWLNHTPSLTHSCLPSSSNYCTKVADGSYFLVQPVFMPKKFCKITALFCQR